MRHIRLPFLLATIALVAVGCSTSGQSRRHSSGELGGGMIASDSFGSSMAVRNTTLRAQARQQNQTVITSVPENKQ